MIDQCPEMTIDADQLEAYVSKLHVLLDKHLDPLYSSSMQNASIMNVVLEN